MSTTPWEGENPSKTWEGRAKMAFRPKESFGPAPRSRLPKIGSNARSTGSKMVPKTPQEAPKRSPRGPKKGPRGSQEGPKRVPRGPQASPRGAKRLQKRSYDSPKASQDASRASQELQESAKRPPRAPKRPQEAPKRPRPPRAWGGGARPPPASILYEGFSGNGLVTLW